MVARGGIRTHASNETAFWLLDLRPRPHGHSFDPPPPNVIFPLYVSQFNIIICIWHLLFQKKPRIPNRL